MTEVDRFWNGKDLLKEGDSFSGRYIEKQENAGKKKNSNIYVFEVSGERVGVWGSAVLDRKMAAVAFGKIVGIEYAGLKQGKENEYHDYWVGEGIIAVEDEVK